MFVNCLLNNCFARLFTLVRLYILNTEVFRTVCNEHVLPSDYHLPEQFQSGFVTNCTLYRNIYLGC